MIFEGTPLGEPLFFEPPPPRLIMTWAPERGLTADVDDPSGGLVGRAKLPLTDVVGATKPSVTAHSVPAPTIAVKTFIVFLVPSFLS